MDCAYGSDSALGVGHHAVGRERQVLAGALEPSPEILAEPGMLSDRLHCHRMKRLQEQRTNPTNEHRRIGVDAPDRILFCEPTLAGSPDLGMLRLEVPGDTFSYRPRQAGARVGERPDRHTTERTPGRKSDGS